MVLEMKRKSRKKRKERGKKEKKKEKKKKRKRKIKEKRKTRKNERPNTDFRVHQSPWGPGASPFFFIDIYAIKLDYVPLASPYPTFF